MKIRQMALTGIVSFLLVLAIFTASIPFAHADGPTLTWACLSSSTGSSTSIFGACGGTLPTVTNAAIILAFSCTTSSSVVPDIIGLSDSNGNLWTVASGPVGEPQQAGNSISSIYSWIIFSNVFTFAPQTSTITISFSPAPANNGCNGELLQLNSGQQVGVAKPAGFPFLFGFQTTTSSNPTNGLSFGFVPFTQPANTMAIYFASVMAGSTATLNSPCSEGQPPLAQVVLGALFNQPCSVTSVTGQFASKVELSIGYNYVSSALPVTYTGSWFFNTFANLIGILVVFTVTTIAPTVCGATSYNTNIGSPTRTSTFTTIGSNQTYVYVAQTASLGGSITNVSIAVQSVALTNGQNSATLTARVYTLANQNPVSTGNPFVSASTASKTWTIVTTNTAYNLVWLPSPAIPLPANGQVAIAIGVSHAGLNVWLANAAAVMQTDTADKFVGTSPPPSLQVLSSQTLSFAFVGVMNVPCSTSTITTSITIGSGTGVTLVASPISATFWYIPLFFILVFPAMWVSVYVLLNRRR